MGVREAINKMPTAPAMILAAVLVAVAVGVAVFTLRGATEPGLDQPVLLRCTHPECGQVVELTAGDVRGRKPTIPDGQPGSPGIACPRCEQSTLALAYRCVNDGTVFTLARGGSEGLDTAEHAPVNARCPARGWDPLRAREQEIARQLGVRQRP